MDVRRVGAGSPQELVRQFDVGVGHGDAADGVDAAPGEDDGTPPARSATGTSEAASSPTADD